MAGEAQGNATVAVVKGTRSHSIADIDLFCFDFHFALFLFDFFSRYVSFLFMELNFPPITAKIPCILLAVSVSLGCFILLPYSFV